MTGGRVIIVRADAASLPLADASVDLVVTSPPYFGMRTYTDNGATYAGQIGSEPTPAAYLAALWACTAEWARVLRPGGSMFVNLGDRYAGSGGFHPAAPSNQGKARRNLSPPLTTPGYRTKTLMGLPWRYALGCVDELGLILRAEVIWAKLGGGLPEPSAVDRVRRAHEQVFHLVKQPRYYYAGGTPPQGDSVWGIVPVPLTPPARLGVVHFAAYPPALVRRIILGWSPPGAVVADPFGGTGTTAVTAAVLGRTGITVDRSADYCRLAAWRTADPGERCRALGVPKPPPVTDGQGELFNPLRELGDLPHA